MGLGKNLGEYATSRETAGASVDLCKLDAGPKPPLDAPAHTPFALQA